MTIRLWKGFHEPELAGLIHRSWDENTLLILCPPLLHDFSFLSSLPPGPLEIFGQWTAQEREALDKVPPGGTVFPEKPVLGVFTSGTLSSSPRLVLYSRRGVEASLSGIFGLFDTSRIEHIFCYPQAFHTFGLTLGYLAAHVLGCRLHTPQGKYHYNSHSERLQLHEENLLTIGTPTHFFDLLLAAKGKEVPPSYACIIGGASVSRALWLSVQTELKIEAPSIGYGCTEAAPGISHLPPGQAPHEDDEIGLPLSSIQSRVLPGEGVEISGDSLCMAIVESSQVEFPKRLIIRDQIEIAESGAWLYRGRLDLLMNRGGAKYSLEAIEKTLFEKLGVNAVACSLGDARLGEDLGLAFAMTAHCSPKQTLESAQTVLKDVYALKLQPEKTRFVTDFPLNESAKLDRKSVRTLFKEEGTIPR